MSDPTADSDARSGAMRQWYEANRETWWQRFWRRNDQADRFMFDLLEEARRINARTGEKL